jgi:hypothetical protein
MEKFRISKLYGVILGVMVESFLQVLNSLRSSLLENQRMIQDQSPTKIQSLLKLKLRNLGTLLSIRKLIKDQFFRSEIHHHISERTLHRKAMF